MQVGSIAEWEHSVILSTFIKLPFVINIFVLSILEWMYETGFTGVEHRKNALQVTRHSRINFNRPFVSNVISCSSSLYVDRRFIMAGL